MIRRFPEARVECVDRLDGHADAEEALELTSNPRADSDVNGRGHDPQRHASARSGSLVLPDVRMIR